MAKNIEKVSRPRGRPRAYEPDVALQKAMAAFWQNGYSGTSLDAIAEATGMNRPSIYAAFGDKRNLYLTTLTRYVEGGGAAITAAIEQPMSLRESLLCAFNTVLDLYCPKEGTPLGCFLLCTAAAEAVSDEFVRVALNEGMRSVDQVFEKRFQRAKAEGELTANADPALLARVASSVMHSVALRSRAGDARADLVATVEHVITLLSGPASAKD